MSNAVTCPSCSHQFEVTEVLAAQLSTQIRSELQREVDAKKAEFELQSASLAKQKLALQQAQESLDAQVRKRMAEERDKLLEKARADAAQGEFGWYHAYPSNLTSLDSRSRNTGASVWHEWNESVKSAGPSDCLKFVQWSRYFLLCNLQRYHTYHKAHQPKQI